MSDPQWNSGYITEIDYTYGYYPELNPLRTKLNFLNSGIYCPDIKTGCELGFGQGLSVNLHAAASNVGWWGTDFNPAQAAFAQNITEVCGSQAFLCDDSFEDFLNRDDLPGFDFIGLHGIWSWVSNENRDFLIRFIEKHLNVGGILYISYNTQPGWTSMIPLREILSQFSKTMVTPGDPLVSRVDNALDFANRLMECNASYFKANPFLKDRLENLSSQNKNYLAHEYFNRYWLPVSFFEMSEFLQKAKLDFACSANPIDHIASLNFTNDQLELMKSIKDNVFKESIKDIMINQQFRKDYWIRGRRHLSQFEQLEMLRNLRVVLIIHSSLIDFKVKCPLGEVKMEPSIYEPIIDILKDNKPKSIGQIEKILKDKQISLQNIIQAVMILCSKNYISYAQSENLVVKNKIKTSKLNLFLCKKARGNNNVRFLASPVTGGGIVVNRFQQLFFLAYETGKKNPNEWALYALKILESQGQRIMKEGKRLETHDENMEELKSLAADFAKKELPVLKALHISCNP